MEQTSPLSLLLIAVAVALVPLLLSIGTSYIKISIVLGLIRNALGTQQVPSNLIIMALSLAVSCYVMSPVMEQTAAAAGKAAPAELLQKPDLDRLQQLAPLLAPWREFLARHAGAREIKALRALSGPAAGDAGGEVPFRLLLPAFVLSELKEAFAMGFAVLLPFLVIDLIVANLLVGLGMFMVSPTVIALPVKLILFVLSDGWLLLVRGLINSYQV